MRAMPRVVVGPREFLRTRTIELKETNWLAPAQAHDCLVKVRSDAGGRTGAHRAA